MQSIDYLLAILNHPQWVKSGVKLASIAIFFHGFNNLYNNLKETDVFT